MVAATVLCGLTTTADGDATEISVGVKLGSYQTPA